ncbi:helix-turn-helix transcriptional regulator [Lactobacillus sp. ESL0684]|uniref:helix-turn-helix domain-containing protein n=1 Tax=unclassified Lactobacillus TaxID=2620435 RepID=UPI0023F6DA1F|nr:MULTISPECIES: helix-turn-helix transcriptional regulator [unclassified Lactobacillus]WEV40324.1 helix-turn-helix transcriptional regulator [Lactobacillus sp. ESL0681]WEV42997.1 helix-turn-helix transcriptional regulator [Lactobacillus sp. ESL0684]
MVEEELSNIVEDMEIKFTVALKKHHMKQYELAKAIGTGPQQLNRALHGDMSPRSKEIRKQAAEKLGLYYRY